ncbi:hypothetical protein [Cohnella rhizosphaerae]|uniref:Uncharacterized protein n=1 Tax=Cohnella rhizosphaerae TaxID=1457232 RepID=A0A9X4QUT6_9BACL|nr:hypothetical protein [Cohnella rhizosphaerae]MDG0811723.1 hypothetical protein [Cohnella rhizosphaerae]
MLERRARRRRRVAAASVVALLIAGAAVFRGELAELLKREEAAKPVISETETTTLNIMYWDNSGFMSLYGQPFIIRHPSVRFEYAEYPGEERQSIQPDAGHRYIQEAVGKQSGRSRSGSARLLARAD